MPNFAKHIEISKDNILIDGVPAPFALDDRMHVSVGPDELLTVSVRIIAERVTTDGAPGVTVDLTDDYGRA